MKTHLVYLVLGLALCMGLLGAQGQNPQWPMYSYDIANTGLCPYYGPDSLVEKWVTTLPDYAQSCPAIAEDGTIYIGTHTDGVQPALHALNPDGSIKWQFGTNDHIWSSPCISEHDGTIFFGCYDDYFYAVKDVGDSAEFQWSYYIGENISSSPVIGPDNKIYVGAWDDKFYAFTAAGDTAWTYTGWGWYAFCSPAIDPHLGRVYCGSYDDTLYAWDYDGNVVFKAGVGGNVWSSPAVGADGTIYVGSYDDQLHAINPDGSPKWTFLTSSNIIGSPSIDGNGLIYIGSNSDSLYCIADRGDHAEVKWAYGTGSNIQCSPTIDANGNVYFGSVDDYLYALDSDGNLLWSYFTGGNVVSSPSIGADGTLYCGSQANKIFAIGGNCGDTNGDGSVTSADGYHSLNSFSGTYPMPVSCWAANVNGDGNFTTADGFHLLNYLGDPLTFPLNCAFCSF